MSLLERLFGRVRGGKGSVGEIDVALLVHHFSEMVPYYENIEVPRDLLRARLVDACRDADLEPPEPQVLTAATEPLDEEGWRRLALEIGALDLPDMRSVLPVAANGDATALLEEGFVGAALGNPLLTLELLHQSAIRTEEFARSFLSCLGVGIAGETEEESRQTLLRLDYGRLLADADRAKKAAEEHTEKLRKQLEEQHARRGRRRGKW